MVPDVVPDSPLTPDLALAYLGELSTDIRAAAVLDGAGSLAAQSGFASGTPEQIQELVGDLFAAAKEATAGGAAADEFEVSLPDGSVFAVRDGDWTLAVVAGRFALSALMLFDLRMVIRDLAGPGAPA